MKVTDEKIKEYCGRMGYKLLDIGKIAFSYQKPNGEKSALLKAAAHSLDHRSNYKKIVEDGEPCDHPGCCSHVSHPCEGCGRTNCQSTL